MRGWLQGNMPEGMAIVVSLMLYRLPVVSVFTVVLGGEVSSLPAEGKGS